jgi:hypothetical protein
MGWLTWAGLYAPAARAEPPPTQSEQGTHLHGTGWLEAEHVNLQLQPLYTVKGCQSVTLQQGGFTAEGLVACTPPDFTGARFTSEDGTTTFRVHAVRVHQSVYASCKPPTPTAPPMDPTWEYEVTWSRGDQSGNVCPGPNVALAVPLRWEQGVPPEEWRVLPTSASFTFACVPQPLRDCGFHGGGVIAKCVDWGFPPWQHSGATLSGTVLQGSTTAGQWLTGSMSEALSFHQTCLRMATADYCGTGRSNTLDGTPIALLDPMYVPLVPPAPAIPGDALIVPRLEAPNEGLAFEAAWADCSTPGPAVPNSACDPAGKGRRAFGAVCLSKKRWASLPVAGTCIDPSTTQSNADPDMKGKPCEDYTEAELEALGARLFSFSRHLDAGLYRFKRTDGSEASITTTAYVVGPNFPLSGSVTLDPKLAAGRPYAYARFEGALLARTLPESLREHLGLVRLYRCVSDTARGPHFFLNTTSTADPKGACTVFPGAVLDQGTADVPRDPVEGYISPTRQGFSTTALSLWSDRHGYLVTATAPPDSEASRVGVIGYIPGNP